MSTNEDIPRTLAEAEQRFTSFLSANGYPQAICWITPMDLVVLQANEYAIRKRSNRRADYFAQLYDDGLARCMGIWLRALCASNDQTFATIFVPSDDTDAQYNLMGGALKMSCPVEKPIARLIANPLKWHIPLARGCGAK